MKYKPWALERDFIGNFYIHEPEWEFTADKRPGEEIIYYFRMFNPYSKVFTIGELEVLEFLMDELQEGDEIPLQEVQNYWGDIVYNKMGENYGDT